MLRLEGFGMAQWQYSPKVKTRFSIEPLPSGFPLFVTAVGKGTRWIPLPIAPEGWVWRWVWRSKLPVTDPRYQGWQIVPESLGWATGIKTKGGERPVMLPRPPKKIPVPIPPAPSLPPTILVPIPPARPPGVIVEEIEGEERPEAVDPAIAQAYTEGERLIAELTTKLNGACQRFLPRWIAKFCTQPPVENFIPDISPDEFREKMQRIAKLSWIVNPTSQTKRLAIYAQIEKYATLLTAEQRRKKEYEQDQQKIEQATVEGEQLISELISSFNYRGTCERIVPSWLRGFCTDLPPGDDVATIAPSRFNKLVRKIAELSWIVNPEAGTAEKVAETYSDIARRKRMIKEEQAEKQKASGNIFASMGMDTNMLLLGGGALLVGMTLLKKRRE
jgi:hypothetical protein